MERQYKVALCIIMTLFLVSCNKVLNRSITEPLTSEELKKAVEIDSDFIFTYEFIKKEERYLQTTQQKAMWQDLSYNRLHKFIKKVMLDADFAKSQRAELEKEWELKYGPYTVLVDSVCNIWETYWDDHKTENYVRIELIDIEKEYMTPPWGGDEQVMTAMRFVIRVTPLRGTIDQLRGNYNLFAKDEDIYFSDLLGHHNWIEINEPFSSPVIVRNEPTLGFKKSDVVKESSLKKVLGMYKFASAIRYIIKDGKKISAENTFSAIPTFVHEYMVAKKNNKPTDTSMAHIVENILKKEYESQASYTNRRKLELQRGIDELAYRFVYRLKK